MHFFIFYMSKSKDFLNFIYTPKEIYSILDKFGYRPGNILIKSVLQKGYAEKRDHKIVLTKLGKAKLNEIESLKNNPIIEELQPVQQITTLESKRTGGLFILGIVGLLGFIFSIWQVSSSKIFMPYGIIGIFFLVSLILSVILFFRK